jgi:hypothetical protein
MGGAIHVSAFIKQWAQLPQEQCPRTEDPPTGRLLGGVEQVSNLAERKPFLHAQQQSHPIFHGQVIDGLPKFLPEFAAH